MTPIEEQQAMQEYVRRQLLARQGGQLNLTPGQQPLSPQDQAQFMQSPLTPGAGPPLQVGEPPFAGDPGPGMRPRLDVSAGSGGPPGLSYGGGYAPLLGRTGQPEPFNAQLMYRKNVPF